VNRPFLSAIPFVFAAIIKGIAAFRLFLSAIPFVFAAIIKGIAAICLFLSAVLSVFAVIIKVKGAFCFFISMNGNPNQAARAGKQKGLRISQPFIIRLIQTDYLLITIRFVVVAVADFTFTT
jgi:hypothetical protein